MSIEQRYVVLCDHEYKPDEYCGEEFSDSDGDGPRAVAFAARDAGWLTVGRSTVVEHYCPIHRYEHETEATKGAVKK